MEVPDTKLLIEELLGDEYCLIHVNPSVKGVLIPEHLRKEPTVTMKLSHYFAGVVMLREDRVEAELRFGSTPYNCKIPYAAVWAISSLNGQLTIWEERAIHPSLPKMLKEGASKTQQIIPVPAAKPALKAIQTTEESEESLGEEVQSKSDSADKKRPSFLKRIK